MNAPQKIASTKLLLDSKIRRRGAPSIHFEEPLKNKTPLVSASGEKGGGEGMEMSVETVREGPGEGEQQPKRLPDGALK